MGSGIAAMHYTGMAALLMMPGIVYDPLWLGLSILIAVIASGAALWIAFRLRHGSRRSRPGPRRRRPGDGLRHRRHALHRDGRRAVPPGQLLRRRRPGIDNGWLAVLVIVIIVIT